MPRTSRAPGMCHANYYFRPNTVSPPRTPIITHGNRNHVGYPAAGQPTPSPSHFSVSEAEIRDITYDLDLASFHVEVLEEELDEADREIRMLREENTMLQKDNTTLKEYLDHRDDSDQDMVLELATHLGQIHENVQDWHHTLQVVLDKACEAEVDESPGYCSKGSWEEMARVWQEGPVERNEDHAWNGRAPVDRNYRGSMAQEDRFENVLPQQGTRFSHGSMTETTPFGLPHHFERSNAPSPEERRPQRTSPDVLRQIETEMTILQLQEHLECMETGVEDLTSRCDAQQQRHNLLVEMLNKHEKTLTDILNIIYTAHEEDDSDDNGEDEPYCMCDEREVEPQSADVNATLRGGMGGRDEDEEFVYDYGGYTNWDQVGVHLQCEDADGSQTNRQENEVIQELRQQIERLDEQVRTLTEAAHRDNPSPYETHHENERQDVNLGGRSGEEEVEMDEGCVYTDTSAPAFVAASPHLLFQRATSRVGSSTVSYIMVYLPSGFIVPATHGRPELVLHNAATIYYFPGGATDNVLQREACKQKYCREENLQEFTFYKIRSKQVFKNAIANMWETMGLSWDVLTHGVWNFDEHEDQGEMYIVGDNDLFDTNRTQEVAIPHIRGGGGNEPDPSIYEPIQIPSYLNENSRDEFNGICERLMLEAAAAFSSPSAHPRGDACMTLASVLQTRNSFLERELENFKEMNQSLIEDLHWQMDVEVEMEERLEAAVAEKNAITEDFQILKTRLAYLVETIASHDVRMDDQGKEARNEQGHTRSPGLGTMRGGDEDSSSSTKSTPFIENNSPQPVHSSPSRTCATITTRSFDFYPRRSTIVFAGAPRYIYQFPHRSTLPEIRSILESGDGEEALSSDPYIARILETMKIREDMGIQLPENLRDELVTIDIPNAPNSSHLDHEIKIAAWQVSEKDMKDLEKLVKKLDIDPDAARSSTNVPARTTSSEGEKDYYQDVGDLVNSLNDTTKDDADTISPGLCTSATHSADSGDNVCNILDTKLPHVVSVRGGGSDSEYWNHDAHGNREFPLHYPKLPAPLGDPPNTPRYHYKLTPDAFRLPEDEEIATQKGPLSMRLGRLMFPAKFIQQREDSINRFDWQHVKRLNLQLKDKSSRGFRYRRGAHCEDWAVELDKHREHCDYCQALFIEEGCTAEGLSYRHEEEASKPTSRARRSREKSIWLNNRNAPNFSAVAHSNPRLRGGAGHESDLNYDSKDSEDWQSEWDDLASQTQSSGCQPRTFRNSSTLSTKTTRSPPSPVDSSSKPRCWPQPSDVCTAEEFLRIEPWRPEHECRRVEAPQVRVGELSKPPYNARHKSPDSLTPSKTSNPFLLELKRSRHEPVVERSLENCETLSIKDSDSVLEFRAEAWLENPRPAPPLPVKRHLGPPRKEAEEAHNIGRTMTCVSVSSTQVNPVPREISFRSNRHEFFPTSEYSITSEGTSSTTSQKVRTALPLSEMLSDEIYEKHVRSRRVEEPTPPSPRPGLSARLCKRCKELLALVAEYITKSRQRLMAERPRKSTSKSALRTPAAPAPWRISCRAWYMNHRLPPLPFDKPLPPTPHASLSSLNMTLERKGKFPAAPEVSLSRLECARAIAQAQDRAHADFVSQGENQWHVPTIAGPSDLVKEALMWLEYEARSREVGKTMFDECMAEDTRHEHPRSNELMVV